MQAVGIGAIDWGFRVILVQDALYGSADERTMKSAVQKAKLGRDEEIQALKRLDNQARRLEGLVEDPSMGSFVAAELAASSAVDGRSVFGWGS